MPTTEQINGGKRRFVHFAGLQHSPELRKKLNVGWIPSGRPERPPAKKHPFFLAGDFDRVKTGYNPSKLA